MTSMQPSSARISQNPYGRVDIITTVHLEYKNKRLYKQSQQEPCNMQIYNVSILLVRSQQKQIMFLQGNNFHH